MRWGAGRPGYRAKAEQLQRVDIRVWRKQGYLTPGQYFSWAWNRGGEPTGSIAVRVHDAQSLSLLYSVGAGHDRRDGSQTIALAHTPCHYGSSRPWFVCPRCQRRAGLLFMRWGRFACRRCQKVTYTSQSEDLMARMWRKQGKIEARLGENWQRPKTMRRRTHEAFIEALMACEARRDEAFCDVVQRFLGLANRL
jgi:hypothetical protein